MTLGRRGTQKALRIAAPLNPLDEVVDGLGRRHPMTRPKQHAGAATPVVSKYANDPDMAELVELFVAELPTRVKAMQDALDRRQVDSLKRSAHQLKGAGGGYGFASIGAAAGKLESLLVSLSTTNPTRKDSPDAMAAWSPSELEGVRRELDELIDLCRRASIR
jgi:HPt (histidine-containing phosphotransfer) domain-containing protein